jgi:hypothetical protein
MDDDRVSTLEQQFAKMEAREVDIQQKLELLLSHALQKPIQPPSVFPVSVSVDAIPRTDARRTTRVARPANPPEFDGDRSKGLAFLNACQTYTRLCPEEFPDDQTKIIWAMSYMKADRAQKWTARVFRWEQQPENSDQNRFLNWEDFHEEFRKEFTPSHADALAINRLESNGYYQKNRSLDDYIDKFQDLIVDSGYTDPKTIVVKLRRGLNTQIQNAVAIMASGRPSDASPEQWYNMARTVDQNRAANKAFSSTYRSPVPSPRPVTTSMTRLAVPSRSVRAGHSHIHPTPGNPVPMDLDTTRGAATAPLCFRCKKPGHFGRDCPTQFDVRSMTIDELQEVLGLRLAELDIAPSDPSLLEQMEESGDF